MAYKKAEMKMKFVREFRRFDNGFSLGEAVNTLDEVFTVKGESKFGELKAGIHYIFFGSIENNEQWGMQFHYDNFIEADIGSDRDSVVDYIKQLRIGMLGPIRIGKIYDKFGEDTLDVISDEPKRLLEVNGVSETMVESLNKKIAAGRKAIRIKSGLLNLLKNHSVRKKSIDKIIDDFGADAIKKIKENAYMLTDYEGIGFRIADAIYLENGGDPKGLERQIRCVEYVVESNRSGDVWMSIINLYNGIEKCVHGLRHAEKDEAIQAAVKRGYIDVVGEGGKRMAASGHNSQMEKEIAEILATIDDDHQWPDMAETPLSDHQSEQIEKALRSRVAVFSGSPGTGKTYTVAHLVKQITETCNGGITILAPTGKAAARASQAMHDEGLGIKAVTAHSYLLYNGDSFCMETIPDKYVIVDETSMQDLSLAHAIISRLSANTHVLFVGDEHQLPPVGAGAPYRDMINSGCVPVGSLTEVRRNSGMIVDSCVAIRDGKKWVAAAQLDLKKRHNLVHVPTNMHVNPSEQLSAVYHDLSKNTQYDLVWDVQTIVPTNAIRESMNDLLQNLLNPTGVPVQGTKFRMNDKLICLQNGRYVMHAIDPNTGIGWVVLKDGTENKLCRVANGEQGEIVDIFKGKIIVKIPFPDRYVSIPMKSAKAEDDDDDADGSKNKWTLGYAVTCHKFQGSQCAVSILIVDSSKGAMAVQTKQWLLTGQSRSQDYGYVIGSRSTIESACRREGLLRVTLLAERIGEARVAKERHEMLLTDDFFDNF